MKKRMISYNGDATAAGHKSWVSECFYTEWISVGGVF